MLYRKITNKLKNSYCAYEKSKGEDVIINPDKCVVTSFYDVEGGFAIPGKSKNCLSSLERILEIESDLSIKSTYNVVAKLVDEAPALFKDIQDEGHEIASHSYDHTVLTTLSYAACLENFTKARAVYDKHGLNVIGHRSPQSMWNLNTLSIMYKMGFKWNAENSNYLNPFKISGDLFSKNKKLWRLPVSIDDWGYEGSARTSEQMFDEWKNYLAARINKGKCLSIGFHPWVEYGDGRIEVFTEIMKWLSTHKDIEMLCFRDIIDRIGNDAQP